VVGDGLPHVRELVFDPQEAGVFCAASTSGVGGLFHSTDGGLSWTGPDGPGVFIRGLALAPPSTLYVAGYTQFLDLFPPFVPEGQVFESSDGGATFERIGRELESFGTHIGPVAVDPHAPSRILVALATGLVRSSNGGRSFRSTDLPDTVVRALAFDPVLPGVVFAGTAIGVFESRDHGRTWTAVNRGLPSLSIRDLAFGAGSPPVLWAGTDGGGVARLERLDPTTLCEAGATRLCLQDGRFEVEVTWETAGGESGLARVLSHDGVSGGSRSDTGFFWFFSPDNVEIALKILDGTAHNGHYGDRRDLGQRRAGGSGQPAGSVGTRRTDW
jgi:hypothetical protein